MKKESLKKINERAKKLIPWLVGAIVLELLIIGIGVLVYRHYVPTEHMSNKKATEYIMSMSDEDRAKYINRMPADEKERLFELLVSYRLAEAENNQGTSFEDIANDTSYDNETSETETQESETIDTSETQGSEEETYRLTDGTGYVKIIDGEYHVYDNDGNEVDPSTKVNESGVIEMELW